MADALLGGWDIGGIVNARSGLPVDVLITRPDVVYVDGAGNVLRATRRPIASAVINTPGGGASRNVRRPDLIPGVDPFIKDGGLLFLNPAAFATPTPGTFGNLERNSIHGPSFQQVDLVVVQALRVGAPARNVEFRVEVFNLFNTVNFTNPVGTLPLALPASSLTEANKRPAGPAVHGRPRPARSARSTSTVGRTVGLGTHPADAVRAAAQLLARGPAHSPVLVFTGRSSDRWPPRFSW